MSPRVRHAVLFAAAASIASVLLFLAIPARFSLAQQPEPALHPLVVTASRYRFDPARIEVLQDDLVKIDLSTSDIAHSFTIDDYRIAKRVNPGRPVTFEFRADRPGTFPFYCNLQIEEGCRQMHGQLIVRPRK